MLNVSVKRMKAGMIRVLVRGRSAMFSAGPGMENVLSDAVAAAYLDGFNDAKQQAMKIGTMIDGRVASDGTAAKMSLMRPRATSAPRPPDADANGGEG